ncbi:NUDIX hydrolase [Parasphingorhabdus pacifica]
MIENTKVPAEGEPSRTATAVVDGEIRAAGAVLWREGPNSRPEVAVVHRPRYDDWSLPKGKLDPGETAVHAAVREVTEETGFHGVVSRFLTRIRYSVPAAGGGRADKVVDYFSAKVHNGRFDPNNEVDEIRWLPTDRAREQLSYPDDSRVLDAFERLPIDVTTVLLVRHANAGNRSEWSGDDTIRPLSESGCEQRDALHSLLPLFGPERVYTAPRLRCEQTVRPVAEDLGIELEADPSLSEEGYLADPEATVERVLRIAAGTGTAVISSQGGVIPDLVARLSESAGIEPGEVRSAKGSVWILTFRHDAPSGNGSGPSPQLGSATYLADPRP